MSLRYRVQIRRRAPGAYVAGRWVAGALGMPEFIMATVQPAQLSDYDQMQALPEGRRVDGMVRVYTDAMLQFSAEAPDASGDALDWPAGQLDRPYLFVARSPWQSNVISHYRYLAAIMPAQR